MIEFCENLSALLGVIVCACVLEVTVSKLTGLCACEWSSLFDFVLDRSVFFITQLNLSRERFSNESILMGEKEMVFL